MPPAGTNGPYDQIKLENRAMHNVQADLKMWSAESEKMYSMRFHEYPRIGFSLEVVLFPSCFSLARDMVFLSYKTRNDLNLP
jgi:hypothetical protein